MAEITASLVKELRERTGAGMMECKKALTENNADIDAAAEWLRKSGLAKADKKADRVTAEGRIAVAQDGGIDVGVVLGERLLALHHAGAGALAQFLDQGSGDFHGITSVWIGKAPLPSGEGLGWGSGGIATP